MLRHESGQSTFLLIRTCIIAWDRTNDCLLPNWPIKETSFAVAATCYPGPLTVGTAGLVAKTAAHLSSVSVLPSRGEQNGSEREGESESV